MARKKEKVKLKNDDWESLFPGTEFKIQSTVLYLEPLAINQLAFILRKLSTVATSLSDVVSSADDVAKNSERIVGLVQVIVEEVPEVLSELSGLDVEDVKGLPLNTAVELFNKCLDVNIDSQESLVENLKELGVKFGRFMTSNEDPTVERTQMSQAIRRATAATH